MAEQRTTPHRPQGVAGTWPPRGATQAGGFAPAGVPLWDAFAARLRALVRAEAGAGRLLPWVPVAFGIGIALYFLPLNGAKIVIRKPLPPKTAATQPAAETA